MHEPQYGEPWRWDQDGKEMITSDRGGVFGCLQDYDYPPDPEEAARIVACVNFCRFIPDEGLVGDKPVGIPLGSYGRPHIATAIRLACMIGATEIRLRPDAFAGVVDHYQKLGNSVSGPSFYVDGCLIMEDAP